MAEGKKKLTRRKFLLGTGAVVGGGLVLGYAALPNQMKDIAAKHKGEGQILSGWIKITPDNKVTVIVPHAEMGQGTHTALPMMAAEELDADWDLVSMEEAPGLPEFANQPLGEGFIVGDSLPDILAPLINKAFYSIAQAMDLQITGGSTSVRFTGQYGMRVAGAAAREMLLRAAAKEWGVARSDLTTEKSFVHHKASGRSASYGSLAQAASEFDPNPTPTLKPKAAHTIVGTRTIKRFDIPGKVNGTAKYGIDAEVDGMLYASIARVPVHGGTITSIDDAAALAMPGVKKVCNLGYAYAVVADKYWRAKKALDVVEIQFEAGGNELVDSDAIFARFNKDLGELELEYDIEEGDVEAAAGKLIEADYAVPYLAHACMEPMNATAWMRDGKLDVWTGTQAPLMARAAAATAAGIEPENVTIHNHMLGGGFGRRIHAENDYVAPGG